MLIEFKTSVRGDICSISEKDIQGFNELIAEFLYESTDWKYITKTYCVFKESIKYNTDLLSLLEVLEKIENIKSKEGEVIYNTIIGNNTRQHEYGFNFRIYSSGKYHYTGTQIHICQAPSRLLSIWLGIIYFIDEFNKHINNN